MTKHSMIMLILIEKICTFKHLSARRAFPLTSEGGAREWFRTLPSYSITSFESLAKKFASQFMAGIVWKKPAQQLMSIKQSPQESLKSYLLRFNQERLAVESQSEQFIHCAIYQGIRKDGALMANLARRPAEGLQKFLDRVEEFVNQEETLRALRGIEEVSRENSMMEKKSKQRGVPVGKGITERRPVKRVEDYNWTLINAPAKEVLMEIKKDPDYKDPPPIKGKLLPHNLHKYCHYHGSHGHWTNSCLALREMIERYIADGKLTCFLGEQKDQTGGPIVDRIPRNSDSSGDGARSDQWPYYRERKLAQMPRTDSRAREMVQRERSRSRGCPDNTRDFPEIQTIAGGFGGGGETRSAHKSCAKEMREVSIYAIRRPLKIARLEKLLIGFLDEDYEGVYLPHSDALVVTMVIANHKIHRVLVDNGSLADILYKSTFDLMKIDKERVSAVRFPLVGFAREQVMPLGSIELQVTMGTPPG
jgi:hypothetical protein